MVMNFAEILQAAKVIFTSLLYPDLKSEAQAATIIMRGQELKMGPTEACQEIRIVRGKMTFSYSWIGGRIKASNKYNYKVTRLDDEGCCIQFYENGEEVYPASEFTKADARKAGLLSNNMYDKYARNMYFSRALTNGARWFCSEVFGGSVYTADELRGDGEISETQSPPSFEYKAVTEKTLTHYDGKLSNGKSTDDYTPEKLKQILTTASTRRKLTARDIELIETALAARSQANGNTEVQAEVSGDSLPSDSAVEGGDVRSDV